PAGLRSRRPAGALRAVPPRRARAPRIRAADRAGAPRSDRAAGSRRDSRSPLRRYYSTRRSAAPDAASSRPPVTRRASRLQNSPDADAPVAHARHLAQAAVDEAVELAAEPQPCAGLGFVAPAGERGATLASVGAEQVVL